MMVKKNFKLLGLGLVFHNSIGIAARAGEDVILAKARGGRRPFLDSDASKHSASSEHII